MSVIAGILESFGYGKAVLVVLALSIFIDISPVVKWNPIKALLGFFGKWFNSSIEREIAGFKVEVNEKFDQLQKEQLVQRQTLNKIIIEQENRELSKLKWEIIDFDNAIVTGTKYSREQYRHMLDNADKYDRMVKQAKEDKLITVPVADISAVKESVENIKKHYEEHKHDQSLLFF